MTSQLDRHNKTDPKPEMLSAVKAGNRICCDERNVCGMFRKEDFLSKDN